MKVLGIDYGAKKMGIAVSDDSGKIEFREFLKMMTSTIGEKNNREDVGKVFSMFSNKSGKIYISDL